MDEFLTKYRNRTEAAELGRLGAATEASKHQHDAATADNTSASEHIGKMQRDGKKLMSEELSKANDEWTKRTASVKQAEIDRFKQLGEFARPTFFVQFLPSAHQNNLN